jgi:pyrroline-5-carboxylate reductase
MASALVSGLLRKPRPGLAIRVAEPNEDTRKRLRAEFGLETFASAADVVTEADVIVLAVKPQVMGSVLREVHGLVIPTQLILSVAAGTTMARIAAGLNPDQAIIRCMPNTPALIGAGITGLCASSHCKPHHREQAERILAATGRTVWIAEEALMDAVTAISGSGPAYFFLLAEALAEAGAALGLPEAVARQLAATTCAGAGAMLANATEGPAELRRRVTSPGGTTQAAVEAFEQGGLRELVLQAARAAEQRGKALAGAQ